MIRQKLIPFLVLLFAAGCVEKDLIPAGGQVKLNYDWTRLAEDGVVPDGMVAYCYPEESNRAPLCFEGEQLKQALPLARGNYRILTFNRNVEHVNFTDLADFERANACLKPYGAKAGNKTLLPVAGWLYGGVLTTLKVDGGGNQIEQTVQMNPYVRRIRVEIETNADVVYTSYGTLDNTAVAISLKDGRPAPMGNGTTRFDLQKTAGGLLADFVIFGVDSTNLSGDDLRNNMNIVVEDADGNKNELNVDVSDKIAGNGDETGGKIEEEMIGIGKVTIVVGGWEADDDDNSLTETFIRLAAYRGVPVRSADETFEGKYGVTVEKAGISSFVLYANNKISVDAAGHSVMDVPMYYPSGKVNIYAYAPYSVSEPSGWTVTGDTVADDLLWTKVTGQTETTEEVSLRFKHLLAAIRVEVVRGLNISGADFDKTEVYIRNTVTSAAIDLKSGVAVPRNVEASEIKAQLTGIPDDDAVAAGSLLIPQTVAAGQVFIFIKVAGRKDLVYTYKHSGELTFEAGKRKVIRLTLNDEPATKAVGLRMEAEITEEEF